MKLLLIARFQSWNTSRKNARHKREFDDGYDWAAGALLRGELSPFDVQFWCEYDITEFEFWTTSRSVQPYPFHIGAIEATNTLCHTNTIKDDRLGEFYGLNPTTGA